MSHYLNRSLEIANETGNLDDKGQALLTLGLAYQAIQDLDKSEELLNDALHAFRELGNYAQQIEVLNL